MSLYYQKEPLPLLETGAMLRVAAEMGWVGFPAMAWNELCFFSGRVSATRKDSYLVDGVAIHGVSGGPAFSDCPSHLAVTPPVIVGVVSAYVPNRATGEALPGVSLVQDLSHLQERVGQFNSAADAIRSANEQPPVEHPAGAGDTEVMGERPPSG